MHRVNSNLHIYMLTWVARWCSGYAYRNEATNLYVFLTSLPRIGNIVYLFFIHGMGSRSTSILTKIKQLLNVKMNMLTYSYTYNKEAWFLILTEITFDPKNNSNKNNHCLNNFCSYQFMLFLRSLSFRNCKSASAHTVKR